MFAAAVVVFILSLFGLTALFALKYMEVERKFVLGARYREWADDQALRLKEFLSHSHVEFSKVVPAFLFLLRLGVHELALLLAACARLVEREAHRLADLVSHKHRFERRESRSEFLKKMGEVKNGGQMPESEDNTGVK